MNNNNGRRGNRMGDGFPGNCICVKCGYTMAKRRGIPCKQEKCPNCGSILIREDGYHHQRYLDNAKS